MNPVDLLIPRSLEANQVLRLRRFGLAVISYAIAMVLVALAWSFGALPKSAAVQIAVAYFVINLGLYAIIRSGFNLRFRDPSLTRFQILAAITILMYIVYHMDHSRNVALFGCFLIFLFGVFRLDARAFTLVTLYTLAAYALVINLLMHLRPQVIEDVYREWISWLILAGLLPCFGVIGGHIAALRRKLRVSMENLRLFADNVPAMTASFDENLRCRFANKNFSAFFEHTPESVVGKHVRELVEEGAYGEIESHFVRALQGHAVTYQRTRKLASGDLHYIEVHLLPHVGDGGKVLGCFAVTTDITEHKLTEERIQSVAHHDSLTGLPNRLLFNDRLGQAISLAKRDSRQFALLYLDLDKFKPVNDNLGHAAGDELLKNVATRIRQQVRESDTVARVGGDEFTVILRDIGRSDEAETVARKIISAIGAPFRLGAQERSVDIGTSIGIALYPAHGLDADTLVKAADAAMYSAKESSNTFRFFDA
ncbi:MAG: diguanylate cyclase [Betaproteobacteria bacterium]|nr:MAG: diguanylate cyclase [Betaproteobacteria bacterium]